MNVGFQTPIRLEAEPVERGFDLRKYLNFLWRHWVFISAVTALALVIAVVNLARTTPLYTSTAQVLLDPRREKVPGQDATLTEFQFYDASAMETQFAIIRSDSLLRRVVIKEQLVPPPPAREQSSPQGTSEEEAKSTEAQRIQDAVNGLRGALGVSRSGMSYVLNISITWTDPVKAAQL